MSEHRVYSVDEIERLTAESEVYRQEYVRVGCENAKLLKRIAELEAALKIMRINPDRITT